MDETSPGTDGGKQSVDGLLEKFHKMQAYLPVLEIMIGMLKNRTDKPRQAQLEKIRYVKELIVEKKLTTFDSLRKCESLLRNYWKKFEDQLDKIPDVVFETTEGRNLELPLKTDSSKSCSSAEDNQGQGCNAAKTKTESTVISLSSDRSRSPDSNHESVLAHNTVSESRRKNKNPIQKLSCNDATGDSSKLPNERVTKPSSLSPVHDRADSKKTDNWPHSHKGGGSSKYIDGDWRDLERHNSKESLDADHHKNRHKFTSGGQSSRFTDSRMSVSPRYSSPERNTSDSKKKDSPVTSRFSDTHLEPNRSYVDNSRFSSSTSPEKNKVISSREPAANNFDHVEFGKKVDSFLSIAKQLSNSTARAKESPLPANSVNDRTDYTNKSLCSDDSSCSLTADIFGQMSKEQIKKFVTENVEKMPPVPPDTKCILEKFNKKQNFDVTVSSTEISPSIRSDFENVPPVSTDNCQKIYQPSSRDPRRHSKDGALENVTGRTLLQTQSPAENTNQLSLQQLHNSKDNINTHNLIPVINQMDNYSNQNFLSCSSQIDNMTNIQPHLPISSTVEPRSTTLTTLGQQQMDVVCAGGEFLLPKSPVEGTGNMTTHLPLPVPHFNNVGNRSSPRDPRRCSQDSKVGALDGPLTIPNMCAQPSVFQSDCRPNVAPLHNIQPLLSDNVHSRIDYCHGIQPPVAYQPDMSLSVRQFPGGTTSSHMPMGNQHQAYRPTYPSMPAPRSMELSGYGRPNLHTVVPSNSPVFNNRPSGPPKVQAPAQNRPSTSDQDRTQNARKKVLNSWLAIDPRHSSKLPSQMVGRSKYSQNSCKFQRPLNNTSYNSQHKGADKYTSDKRKDDQRRRSSDSNASKNSREGEKDLAKKKTETSSQSKSGSVPNSPAPNNSLFGAIIVPKDGKGKDVPQKFRIPKIKKAENSNSAADNECSKISGKEDEEAQLQRLIEKSLESDSVKKKLLDAIRTLGIEIKPKNGDPDMETLKSEVQSKVTGVGSKSEEKQSSKKSSKIAEKKIKKYVISSSDDDIPASDDLILDKTVAKVKSSSKQSEQDKQTVVVSSDSSCDEKSEKLSVGKLSKSTDKKKINIKKMKEKSGNADIAKPIESNKIATDKVVESQDPCLTTGKEKVNRNSETASSKSTGSADDSKKIPKRVRDESDNVVNKLSVSISGAGDVSASKRTKTSESNSKKVAGGDISDEDAVREKQKSNKEVNQKKRTSTDVLEVDNDGEDHSAKKRKKLKVEKQLHTQHSNIVDLTHTPLKKIKVNIKKMKLLNATDSSGDELNAVSKDSDKTAPLQKTKTVAAGNDKKIGGKDGSASSSEESFDSSFSSKTRKKGTSKALRNSLDSSEDEIEEKLLSKKTKKKILVRKKSKAIIEDSSEDEELENKHQKYNKHGEKKAHRDTSPTVSASENSNSKGKNISTQKERNKKISDDIYFGKNTRHLRVVKAKESASESRTNSDTDDDSSGNENNGVTRMPLQKRLRRSGLTNSDVGNIDSDTAKTRSGMAKMKGKKYISMSESDDSIDLRYSDRLKMLNAPSRKGKENEISKFVESHKSSSENKDSKQIRKSARRRNALEMLHDDIREMFIGNEVALAFGQRKCTLKSQNERKGEEAAETEDRKKHNKKRHVSKSETRKSSVSLKISSEESDSYDECERLKSWKDEKKLTKVKIVTRQKDWYGKDAYSSSKLRVLARKPYKEIYREIEFVRENFADSFYFCKNKPGKLKNSRTKLQDVIGKLWSRVFKLGMIIQMESSNKAEPHSEEKKSKLENHKSDCSIETENKSELKGAVVSSINPDTTKTNVQPETAKGKKTAEEKVQKKTTEESIPVKARAERVQQKDTEEKVQEKDTEGKVQEKDTEGKVQEKDTEEKVQEKDTEGKLKEKVIEERVQEKEIEAKVPEETTKDRVNINVENCADLQVEHHHSGGRADNARSRTSSDIEQTATVTLEREQSCGRESKLDNSVKQTNPLAESETLRNVCVEEGIVDGNTGTSTLVDECDDTVSNISVYDSDVSEKGSEISLPESERSITKKRRTKSVNPGKARAKRKKKISSWQNGVIKKSNKHKQKNLNEIASISQDRTTVSPVPVKEKLLENNKICDEDLADPSYAIDGRGKYDCKYCNFSGVKIVPHYKTSHPDKEVCVSRLPSVVAQKAKSGAQSVNNEGNEELESSSVRRQKRTFVCIICHQFAEYIFDFYCHVSTHTGEYDFKCDTCSYSSSNISSVKHHILLRHNEFSKPIALKRGPPNTARVMYGYLCSLCNFIQLLKENMESHIALRHPKDAGAEVIRINMSIPLEEQSTDGIQDNPTESAVEQKRNDEMHTGLTEDTPEDSVSVDHTNVEETASGSNRRISSRNVPASMNPVVVLKGMKRLMDKGTANPDPKAAVLQTQHESQDKEGKRVESSLSEEGANTAEGSTSVERSSVADIAKDCVASVHEPAEVMTVNQVVAEEGLTVGVDSAVESSVSLNENGNVQATSPSLTVGQVSEAIDTSLCTVGQAATANFHLNTTGSKGHQEKINSSQDSERSNLPETRDIENVTADVDCPVTNEEESTDAVCRALDVDLLSSDETGDKSPARGSTVAYKRSSLLERIEFLCAQSNAADKQSDVPTTTKCSKMDSGKSKKNMVELAERSITTRAGSVAQKQISYVENVDTNRVAVENDGALIGYSSGTAAVSPARLEPAVVCESISALGDGLKEIASDGRRASLDSVKESVAVPDHNYIKVVSPSQDRSTVKIKQEVLEPKDTETECANENRLELYDITSMPDPNISSICIGPMEARREGERILFCCRISGCDFQCPQVVKFACHYNTEHDKEWDGFCHLCGEVIDGIKPFCLEQAVEHLFSFHLTSKLKQKKRTTRNSPKTRSPSCTLQKANKVVGNSYADSTITTTANSSSSCVTTSVVTTTCTTSSVATSVATIPECKSVSDTSTSASQPGNSCAETQSVTELLKNAVVIKTEPCDGEPEIRSEGDKEPVIKPSVVCPVADVVEERPRIRVRRISGDRLSMRTDECRVSPVCPVIEDAVPTKVERVDADDMEQFAAVEPDVCNDVAQSAPAALWPELSGAECDETVLDNVAGRCSPVFWGETGGDGGDLVSSIRITSVVSLNPEANIQEAAEEEEVDIMSVTDTEPGSPPPVAASKTYSRLQVDARSIALGGPPTTVSRQRAAPVEKAAPTKRAPSLGKPKSLQSQPGTTAGLHKAMLRSPSRVAVIKPLSNEVSSRDIVPGLVEKRSNSVLQTHKIANMPQFSKTNKTAEAFATMLEPVKLQRLFKCMHSTCVFATGFEDRFVAHCKAHERTVKPGARTKQHDWSRCAYCVKACESVEELVSHILEEHGYSVYQCAYCFFRAMSPTYVLLHQKSTHVREAVAIIMDQRRRQMPELKDFPDKKENRRVVVLPYICAQGSCGKRFYQCDDFLQHLKKEHSQLTIYSCHLCECKSIKPEALLSHYKWHCLYQYQCLYCLHGADSAVDMKHHLCSCHSDQPNKAIIRIFQDNDYQCSRQVEDLLTIDLDEGMDYANLFVQCPGDEREADNVEAQATGALSGHVSPATSEGSFALECGREVSSTPQQVQKPANKPGPKPKGMNVPAIIGLEGHDLFHCGNKGCIHTSATSSELRDHLSMCDFARESSMVECVHCKKKFKTIGSLVEHLLSHGAERFCCSNCGFKSTVCSVVEKHCKQVHKFPATRMDPVYTGEVNTDTMWYVIRPREKRKMVKSAKLTEKKSTYEPKDIHKLPDKDIYKESVVCSICSYSTKVRVNMVRHLEMHETDKCSVGGTVPTSCPVNPVPCLNRTEMMFDKMENLAASSQAMQAARLGVDNQPTFVQERFRYVCGVADCRYMGCDEEMLRTHIRTLHTGDATYLCAHCKQQVGIGPDVGGVLEHLRMHGGKLFRCTYCAFFHYQVAQVEKHAAAKHPNQPIVPITIRRVVD